jgi:lysosomal acid lipase/cholesteryl ester hydrolase
MNIKGIFLILFYSLLLSVHNEDYKKFIDNLNLNLEEVNVTTEDSYVNTVWVVTSKDTSKRNGQSVILVHGLLDGGISWLVNEENSLAKILCDQGYIVYLPYLRGSVFSNSHLYYKSSKYWDFSFDEMAKYDVPAIINLVKKRDNIEKVIYVGFSQGTLLFFLEYMNDPEFMERSVKKFVALGPIPNINHSSHPILKILQKSNFLKLSPTKKFMYFPEEMIKLIMPFYNPSRKKSLINKIFTFFYGGKHDTKRFNFTKYGKNLLLYQPCGTSLQNMKHWIQIYSTKKVQKYDYGKIKNLFYYKRFNPPAYDLNQMKKYSIPSLMTISDVDPYSNAQDTLDFVHIIEDKKVVEFINVTNYNHVDYFYADSAVDEIFPNIFNFLEK